MTNRTKQKFIHPFKRDKNLQGIKKIKALTTSLFIGLSETVKKLTEKMKTTLHKVLAKSNKQFLFFSHQIFFFDFPLSAKPLQSRMGKGKANIKEYIASMTKSVETFFINPIKEKAKLTKVLITKIIKQKVSYRLLKQYSYKNIENKKKVNLYSLFENIIIDINIMKNIIKDIAFAFFNVIPNEWYDPIIQELFIWITETIIDYFKKPEIPQPKLISPTLEEPKKMISIMTKILNKVHSFFNIPQLKVDFYHYCYPIYAYIKNTFISGIFIEKYSKIILEYFYIKKETNASDLLRLMSQICIILCLPLSIGLFKRLINIYNEPKIYNLTIKLNKYINQKETVWKTKYNNYNKLKKINKLDNNNLSDLLFYSNYEIKNIQKYTESKVITIQKKQTRKLKKYKKFYKFLEKGFEELSKTMLEQQLKNIFYDQINIKEQVFATFFKHLQQNNKKYYKESLSKTVSFEFNKTKQTINGLLLKQNNKKDHYNNQTLTKSAELLFNIKKIIVRNQNNNIKQWLQEYTEMYFNDNLLKMPLLEEYYYSLIITLERIFSGINKKHEKQISDDWKKKQKKILKQTNKKLKIIHKIMKNNKEFSEDAFEKLTKDKYEIPRILLNKKMKLKFNFVIERAIKKMKKKNKIITTKNIFVRQERKILKYIEDRKHILFVMPPQPDDDLDMFGRRRKRHWLEYLGPMLDYNKQMVQFEENDPNKQQNLFIYIIIYPYIRLFADETYLELTFIRYVHNYYLKYKELRKKKPSAPDKIEQKLKEKMLKNDMQIQITPTFILTQRKYREIIISHMVQAYRGDNNFKKYKDDNLVSRLSKFIRRKFIDKEFSTEFSTEEFLILLLLKLVDILEEHFDNYSKYLHFDNYSKYLLNTINKINNVHEFFVNNILAYNKDIIYNINNIMKSSLNNIMKSSLYKKSNLHKFNQLSTKFYNEKIVNKHTETLQTFMIDYYNWIRDSKILFLKEQLSLNNEKNNEILEEYLIVTKIKKVNSWLIDLDKKINKIQNILKNNDKKIKNHVKNKTDFFKNVLNSLEKSLNKLTNENKAHKQFLNNLQKLFDTKISIDRITKDIHSIHDEKIYIKELNNPFTMEKVLQEKKDPSDFRLRKLAMILDHLELEKTHYNYFLKLYLKMHHYQNKLSNKFILFDKVLSTCNPEIKCTSFEKAIMIYRKQNLNRVFCAKNNLYYFKKPVYISELFPIKELSIQAISESPEFFDQEDDTITPLEEKYDFVLYFEDYSKMHYTEDIENFYKFPLTKHNYFHLKDNRKCHLINVTKKLEDKLTFSERESRDAAWDLYRASTNQQHTYSPAFFEYEIKFGDRFLQATDEYLRIDPRKLLLPLYSFNGILTVYNVATCAKFKTVFDKFHFRDALRYVSPESEEVEEEFDRNGTGIDLEDDDNFTMYQYAEDVGMDEEDKFPFNVSKKEAEEEFQDIYMYGRNYFIDNPFYHEMPFREVQKAMYRWDQYTKNDNTDMVNGMTDYSLNQSVAYNYLNRQEVQGEIFEWSYNAPFGPLFNKKDNYFLSNEECLKHIVKYTKRFYDNVDTQLVNERLFREKQPLQKEPDLLEFNVRKYYKNLPLKN